MAELPSTRPMARYPSCLISYTQSSPSGSFDTRLHSMGSTKRGRGFGLRVPRCTIPIPQHPIDATVAQCVVRRLCSRLSKFQAEAHRSGQLHTRYEKQDEEEHRLERWLVTELRDCCIAGGCSGNSEDAAAKGAATRFPK